MTNDLVSDMLTRLRNATFARHIFTNVRYSNLTLAILKVLKSEGYISNFIAKNEKNQKVIKVFLRYKGWWIKKPLFSIIRRISKPGNRIFSGYKNFKNVIDILKYEQGTAIVSTSAGVMSHNQAMKLKKGGEIICYIG
jgi:small subunit ribosomal protein S8